jgi:hypothetical protein
MADINLGVGGANSATGGFNIDNSLKFEADNTEYMKFTSSQTGSDLKRMAFNIWLKRTELGRTQTFMLLGNGGSNSTRLDLSFDSSDRLQIRNVNSNWRLTTQVFRDTSAWYHLFFQFNTLDTTADDRIKVWVNGNLIAIGDYTTVNDPGYNATLGFNRNYANILGGRELEGSNSQMFSGYIAQVYGSGGTPPSVTDFGEFDEDTGIWKPIDISGISPPEPINGFFLDFSDASDLGNDASGNGNDFTLNNITAADQATDTPTNNFCTLNVISAIGNNTYTEGATKGIANAQNEQAEGTFMINKGKWYFEAQNITSYGAMFGFGKPNNWATSNPNNPGNDTSSFAIANDGNVYYNNNTAASGWAAYATTDKAMIAVDLDNGFCYFGKNGIWGNSGDPTSGSSGTGGFNYVSLVTNISLGDELVPALRISYTQTHGAMFNFGGYTIMTISSAASDDNGYGTFEYAPPSGYYALCTKNLAEYG